MSTTRTMEEILASIEKQIANNNADVPAFESDVKETNYDIEDLKKRNELWLQYDIKKDKAHGLKLAEDPPECERLTPEEKKALDEYERKESWEEAFKEPAEPKDQNKYSEYYEPAGFKMDEDFNSYLAREQEEQKRADLEAYKKSNNSYMLDNVIKDMKEHPDEIVISTGFKNLDTALKGGLRESLYLLGAAPSMGKTTLAMQIADHIASSGHDVLVFTLEMSNKQLIRKSLSRIMFEICIEKGINHEIAKDSIEIIDTILEKPGTTEQEKEVLAEAIERYKAIGEHMHVIEARGASGVNSIRNAIKRHKDLTGNAPVVLIDYLQILAPPERNFTEKQNIDKTMTELKRMSVEFESPILAISSFNRDNYDKDANMKAWRDSGAAEYGADNMLVLQFKGTGGKGFDMDKLKEKEVRQTEIKMVKGRELDVGTRVEQKYFAKYNYFLEV